MNWTYDATVRALYVEIADGPSEQQVELAPGIIADLDDSGSLVGLEVLNWQSVDVDAIAKRFGLGAETAKVLSAIILQPVVTAALSVSRPAEGSPAAGTSFVTDAEASATANTTPAPDLLPVP